MKPNFPGSQNLPDYFMLFEKYYMVSTLTFFFSRLHLDYVCCVFALSHYKQTFFTMWQEDKVNNVVDIFQL